MALMNTHRHSVNFCPYDRSTNLAFSTKVVFLLEVYKPVRKEVGRRPAYNEDRMYIVDIHVGFQTQTLKNVRPGTRNALAFARQKLQSK